MIVNPQAQYQIVSITQKTNYFGRYSTDSPEIDITLPSEEIKEKWQKKLAVPTPRSDIIPERELLRNF
ncbi:hypothetical protein MYX06_03065 [Patescibacteria group bacterium AH-259-L05]|nr:hypothetical protein [Patescibacteria group bacterium AH-259-L05]